LANAAYGTSFFAEGGAPTLELQAIAPIINPLEMDMDTDSLVGRIAAIPLYRDLFRKAWGDDTLDFARVTKAIASFERALISGGSPYDRWINGDAQALSDRAVRGAKLFFGEKADCFHCHGGFNFTDQGFHNTGLDPATTDPGRIAVTDRLLDDGKFKTPSLRNIALTAPYMHDGRFATLRQAIDHYNSGSKGHPNQDPLMRPLGLSEEDIQDLIGFLESLTDSAFVNNPDFSDPWAP
jgi:cytochrome c peroxidase